LALTERHSRRLLVREWVNFHIVSLNGGRRRQGAKPLGYWGAKTLGCWRVKPLRVWETKSDDNKKKSTIYSEWSAYCVAIRNRNCTRHGVGAPPVSPVGSQGCARMAKGGEVPPPPPAPSPWDDSGPGCRATLKAAQKKGAKTGWRHDAHPGALGPLLRQARSKSAPHVDRDLLARRRAPPRPKAPHDHATTESGSRCSRTPDRVEVGSSGKSGSDMVASPSLQENKSK